MKNRNMKFAYLGMWRRKIALILVCCVVFTLMPATAWAEEEKPIVENEGVVKEDLTLQSDVTPFAATETTTWDIGAAGNEGNVTATLSADKTTLTISGVGAMMEWIGKAPWTTMYVDSITTVTIDGNVTNIGSNAFSNCKKLTNVTIPEGVTSIGTASFRSCKMLEAITIPSSVVSIEREAFYDCQKLKGITIPQSVTNIGSRAFEDCVALTSIIIPERVTSIGASAFYGCRELATVTINFNDDKRIKIGRRAFDTIAPDPSINVVAGDVPSNPFQTWSSEANSGGTAATFTDATVSTTTLMNVPSDCSITAKYTAAAKTTWDIGAAGNEANVTAAISEDKTALTISGTGAMKDWINDVDVPWNVDVENITTLTISDEVTNIGKNAFFGCKNLQNIKLPKALISIGDYAFNGCSALTTMIIPDKVTSIGKATFAHCTALTSVTIPEGVTIIGMATFWECTKMATIKLPETLTTIESKAFDSCEALTTIDIPTNVTSIEDSAFRSCTSLATVIMHFGDGTVKNLVEGAFYGMPSSTTITVVAGDAASKTFKKWSSEASGTDIAATFADATASTTTLTNVPSNSSITAVYETDPIKGNPVTEEMIQTIDAQKYTGSALEPALTVQDGEKMLTVGTDYSVTYGNNINAGTATATIAGAGKYTGTASKTFIINKADGTAVNGYAVPGTLKAITNITPMLSNIALDGKGKGTWSWVADQELIADNTKQEQIFQAIFTPTDRVNYEVVKTGVKVAVSTISLAKNKMYKLKKGDVETVEQLVTIIGATLKEGTDYKIKLTVDKDNVVAIKNNEIQAKNGGVVRVLMDIMIGTKKAASEPLIVEIKPEQGEQSNTTAEEIKDLLNEVSQDSNTPGEIVNAIADATIRMDQKEKEKLSNETLKTLDEVFQKANPNLVVKAPIIEQMGNTENPITQANISGIALAAGLTSDQIKNGSTVQLKIEQEVPFKATDDKKAQMQLKLTLLVNGQKTQLASPVIIDIQLDKNMETQGLEIMHQHDDGKIDLLTEGKELTTKTFVINKNTSVLTMQVASFSTFTFTTNKVQVEAEKPLIPLTPPKPLNPGDGKTYKASAVLTGDDTPIGAIMAMVLLGVFGMAGVIWTKKKNR